MSYSNSNLDPEKYLLRAISDLDIVNKAEADAWLKHPCTRSLVNSLKGDMYRIIVEWMNSGYAEKSAEATAQLNAKALGKIQTIDEIIEQIDDIGRLEMKGEEYDTSTGPQGIG